MRIIALLSLAASALVAQNRLTPGIQPFVSVNDPVVALIHVRVIDGTGAPAAEDQTVVIDHGKIAAVGLAASTAVPPNARHIDLAGHTVIPGLVGMHEHLFYPSGEGIPIYTEQAFSFPRLYLASGVTTARTAGSMEPYTDMNVKALIDAGRMPGPEFYITGPYLEGAGSPLVQLHQLSGPDDARKTVEYWAGEGATSFKAYMYITRAELAAAIDAAHKLGLKVTGHLCAVGFREAAGLGIDNLEHGLVVDTEFDPGKSPDNCPSQNLTRDTIVKLDVKSEPVQQTIRDLVEHHVAVTSTLAVFDAGAPHRPPLDQRLLDVLTPQGAITYMAARARASDASSNDALEALKREEQFEYDFVKAGGHLMSGVDPTGNGGAMAGFGDLRNLELLVEAEFTPVQAVQIATLNGAKWLKIDDRVGTVTPGKQADLVVIQGNPAARISDVRNVKMVFKNGVPYDPEKLIKSVDHTVGLH
ncbi:MAG TPA: amidohydrolase family protein [Bryobacteraceae bacterium]|nr:amidohydrolase family protein [Bryobacteraceae bacterium]